MVAYSKLLLAFCSWGSAIGFVLNHSPARISSSKLNIAPDSQGSFRDNVRTSSRERFGFPTADRGGALQRRRRPAERGRPPMREDQYYRDRRPVDRDARRPMDPRRGRSIHRDPVQGGSLRTYDSGGYYDRDSDMEITLETEGRPLDALYEVWDGPNRTPTSIRAYSEDGALRPFHATVGNSPTHSVRNIAPLEFPLASTMTETPRGSSRPGRSEMAIRSSGGGNVVRNPAMMPLRGGETIQGGSLKYYYFNDPAVESVHITLYSEGMPMKAYVELLQGPNSVRQIAEIDSEDGFNYPLECEVETPGHGSTIQIRNSGPMEFPLNAIVVPRYA